jgi:hypothetical protein
MPTLICPPAGALAVPPPRVPVSIRPAVAGDLPTTAARPSRRGGSPCLWSARRRETVAEYSSTVLFLEFRRRKATRRWGAGGAKPRREGERGVGAWGRGGVGTWGKVTMGPGVAVEVGTRSRPGTPPLLAAAGRAPGCGRRCGGLAGVNPQFRTLRLNEMILFGIMLRRGRNLRPSAAWPLCRAGTRSLDTV